MKVAALQIAWNYSLAWYRLSLEDVTMYRDGNEAVCNLWSHRSTFVASRFAGLDPAAVNPTTPRVQHISILTLSVYKQPLYKSGIIESWKSKPYILRRACGGEKWQSVNDPCGDLNWAGVRHWYQSSNAIIAKSSKATPWWIFISIYPELHTWLRIVSIPVNLGLKLLAIAFSSHDAHERSRDIRWLELNCQF